MKRMHVHVAVDDLPRAIGFYSALFAAQPSVAKTDYAKWMLDDPRVNFAISTRGRRAGLDHLGIQVEDKDELNEIYARLHKAGGNVVEQGQTSCCYAKSEKSWIDDPAGISWETFLTTGESTDYGDGSGEREARVARTEACCAPQAVSAAARRGVSCSPSRRATGLLDRSGDGVSVPWTGRSTCCFSAPAIPPVRSWRKRSSIAKAAAIFAHSPPAVSRKGGCIRTPSICCAN